MSSENRGRNHLSPAMREDLRPTRVEGPPDYGYSTEGPVRYVAVAGDAGVLGYLWFAEAEDAAGFVPRKAAGDDAFNAGVAWRRPLRACKARGLTPAEALGEFLAGTAVAHAGGVVPGSETAAPDLATVRRLGDEGAA
jgi:hypothetical protein